MAGHPGARRTRCLAGARRARTAPVRHADPARGERVAGRGGRGGGPGRSPGRVSAGARRGPGVRAVPVRGDLAGPRPAHLPRARHPRRAARRRLHPRSAAPPPSVRGLRGLHAARPGRRPARRRRRHSRQQPHANPHAHGGRRGGTRGLAGAARGALGRGRPHRPAGHPAHRRPARRPPPARPGPRRPHVLRQRRGLEQPPLPRARPVHGARTARQVVGRDRPAGVAGDPAAAARPRRHPLVLGVRPRRPRGPRPRAAGRAAGGRRRDRLARVRGADAARACRRTAGAGARRGLGGLRRTCRRPGRQGAALRGPVPRRRAAPGGRHRALRRRLGHRPRLDDGPLGVRRPLRHPRRAARGRHRGRRRRPGRPHLLAGLLRRLRAGPLPALRRGGVRRLVPRDARRPPRPEHPAGQPLEHRALPAAGRGAPGRVVRPAPPPAGAPYMCRRNMCRRKARAAPCE
ncbi:hypothetical protein SGPA1_12077 [Streptomyces misionensis JCM 4497]